MKLGSNIKEVCKRKGWSLSRLAHESGVPKTTLHHWSVGRGVLDLRKLQKVSQVLEISFHELIFGEPDPFHKDGEEFLREIFNGDIRLIAYKIERNHQKKSEKRGI